MQSEKELLALVEELGSFERKFRLAKRFNIFDAVKMSTQEIRHSSFLAFLLNPEEAHGLGDKFLRAILLSTTSTCIDPTVSRLAIAVSDCSNALVYCERDRIDITVQIPELKLIFAIENKIRATEGIDQLQRYRETAERRYPDHKFVGCFLTPDGYEGADSQWGSLSYGVIVCELRRLLAEEPVATEIALIINHYIELVERKVMVSDELIAACRTIYARHRAALDLITQHGDVPVLAEAFNLFQAENPKLEAATRNAGRIDFVHSSWLDIAGFQIADPARWQFSCPVKFMFELKATKLAIVLEVGPVLPHIEFQRRKFAIDLGGRPVSDVYTRVETRTHALKDSSSVAGIKAAMCELWGQFESAGKVDAVRVAAGKGISPVVEDASA
ncbi:MAG: PD-(D/E)XK nuclease family protein [Pseudomonadota bacterium]